MPIPDDHLFFCGLAIGHCDAAAPINRFAVARAPLDEVVNWVRCARPRGANGRVTIGRVSGAA